MSRYHLERSNIAKAKINLETCQKVCNKDPERTAFTRADNEFCSAELCFILNDGPQAMTHARSNIEILLGNFELHPKDKWRIPRAYKELSVACLAAGEFEDAVRQADLAIVTYATTPANEYPDWPTINKGQALCNLGRLEEASQTLEDYLQYKETAFGSMDCESFT